MRILAFTDIHERPPLLNRLKRIVEAERVDAAVCVGDFTIFGRSTKAMLAAMESFGVPVVLIHGNHEDEQEILQLLPEFPDIHFVHNEPWELRGFTFLGFGGGGFSREESGLEELERRHAGRINERTVFLCHAPPYGTALDEVESGWHTGNETLTRLIRRRKPLLVLSGHIHECFHNHDELAGTTLINPGPEGEIIDLEE
jgi:hypothetical protein